MTQADENITGVTGAHTTDGLPHGVTSLTPFIAIRGAAEAIEFYQNVFGARLIDKTEFGGVIVHADIDFGTGHLQLGEPNEEYGLIPAPATARAQFAHGQRIVGRIESRRPESERGHQK